VVCVCFGEGRRTCPGCRFTVPSRFAIDSAECTFDGKKAADGQLLMHGCAGRSVRASAVVAGRFPVVVYYFVERGRRLARSTDTHGTTKENYSLLCGRGGGGCGLFFWVVYGRGRRAASERRGTQMAWRGGRLAALHHKKRKQEQKRRNKTGRKRRGGHAKKQRPTPLSMPFLPPSDPNPRPLSLSPSVLQGGVIPSLLGRPTTTARRPAVLCTHTERLLGHGGASFYEGLGPTLSVIR